MDIGIDTANGAELAKGLSHVLADTYTLYLKTHNFHWRVTGPMFQTLPTSCSRRTTTSCGSRSISSPSASAALGFPAPATSKQFGARSSISEEEGVPKGRSTTLPRR